jgi:signal-transduction protein with cAMP-binding, CBS, and nucleotidyltransferase domain
VATKVREVMSDSPVIVDAATSLTDCARQMEDRNIGSLGVEEDGELRGVLTDRDIVVRAVARGEDPHRVTAGEVCTGELVTISPDASLDDAERTMSERGVRRLFVLDGARPIGLVAVDDLRAEREPESVEAQQLGIGSLIRGYQGETGIGE